MAQRMIRLAFLGALGLSVALGCSPAATTQPGTPSAGTGTSPVAGGDTAPRALTFASDIDPVLRQHCMGCHTEGRGGAAAVAMYSASGEPLTANVAANIGRLIQAIEAVHAANPNPAP